jgi:hypothetical protein
MALDSVSGFEQIGSKVKSYNVQKETIENSNQIKNIQKGASSFDGSKSEALRTLNDMGDLKQRSQQQVKTVFDDLVDLFKQTIPSTPGQGSSTVDFLIKQVLNASQNTKSRIGEIIVDEIMKNAGCSEEQNFDPADILYIRLSQIDVRQLLKNNPEEGVWDVRYEKGTPINGVFPFQMNKVLYRLTQNQGQYFSSQFLYGSSYIGDTGNQIMDISYVNQRLLPNGSIEYDDFLEIDLSNRVAGNNISDFLRDYYRTINIVDFNVISSEIMNQLTNFVDISAGFSSTQLEEENKFGKIIQRILGLCFDSREEIDVQGTAKLSQLDNIDDSFFEMSPFDLKNIEADIDNILNGVTEFEDCGKVKFPVDTESISSDIRQVINIDDSNADEKVNKLVQAVENISNNEKWVLTSPGSLNVNTAIKNDLLKIIPKGVILSIISPKMLLGFMVVLKSIRPQFIDNLRIDSLSDFINNFKTFIVGMVSKISAIFIEELFKLIKKNIKLLVETLLLEIIRESKSRQLQIISTVVFLITQTISGIIDYRKCKSLVDEILNLLNLTAIGLGSSIPSFALAGSVLLGGFSATRAMSQVTENLQSLGLPTGDLPSGAPNIALQALQEQIKGVYEEQIKNGKVEVFVPPLAVPPIAAGLTAPGRGIGKFY